MTAECKNLTGNNLLAFGSNANDLQRQFIQFFFIFKRKPA